MLSGQIEGLVALHDRLEALGHSVELVSAFRAEELHAERRWARDVGDGLSLAPKVVRIGRIVSDIAARARDCDVLHFNVPTPAFGILADLVQLLTRRPLVVGFEAHLANIPAVARRLTQAPEFYGPRLIVNNGIVARVTLKRGRRYVVSSEFQRRELLSLGYASPRIDVIPNLFDEGKLQRWDKVEARRALNLPETDPLVVFVGHYHDVKGHDVLIDAFSRVRDGMPGARLVLAWSGIGHRTKVQAAIQRAGIGDSVIELGRSDVGQLFSAADVVALPYRFSIGQAAYPGTVLEAMWTGAPVVTTDLPLLRELADEGRIALLAEPGDPVSLAGKIVELLKNGKQREALQEAQRVAMAERFSGEHLIHRYVAVYEAALAGVPVGAWSVS